MLSGEQSHVNPTEALLGLSWQIAGKAPHSAPHSIYMILNHMIYWQHVYLKRVEGVTVESPSRPSEGWPGAQAPADAAAWDKAVGQFQKELDVAMNMLESRSLAKMIPTFGALTFGEGLALLAMHNSYHTAQIVALRQVLGDWPQPEDAW